MTVINYISIMDNYHEYLLSVAEKIIAEFADKKTLDKYYNLKAKLMSTHNFKTEPSHLALSTFNKENSKCATLKTSVVDEAIKKKSKCKTRQSASKSKLSENPQLSRARIQSYQSKVTERSSKMSQTTQSEGYHALLHTATLIKNAELCPGVLKTITFHPNTFSEKVNSILEIIANSLSSIYKGLQEKQCRVQTASQASKTKEEEAQQIIKDNKWLMSKLEAFLDENSTLRRMIGQRVY